MPIALRVLPMYNDLVKWSTSGFLMPSGLTYIDFVVVEHIHTIFNINRKLAENYPALRAYRRKIHSLPGVAEYVKTRPESAI